MVWAGGGTRVVDELAVDFAVELSLFPDLMPLVVLAVFLKGTVVGLSTMTIVVPSMIVVLPETE